MKTKLEQAKEIVTSAVKYYLEGCDIDAEDYEDGEAQEGTGLSFDELMHPSGGSVEEMINEIEDDDDWSEDYLAVDLKKHEDKVFAEILADMLSEKSGKDFVAEYDREAVTPFSRVYGAWIISLNEEDEEDEEDE